MKLFVTPGLIAIVLLVLLISYSDLAISGNCILNCKMQIRLPADQHHQE